MFLETGYVYHIKDEYFEFAKDEKLMKNHENGNTRPTYQAIAVVEGTQKEITYKVNKIFTYLKDEL